MNDDTIFSKLSSRLLGLINLLLDDVQYLNTSTHADSKNHYWVPCKTNTPKITNADLIILAGEIHVGVETIEWINAKIDCFPVFRAPGRKPFSGRARIKNEV